MASKCPAQFTPTCHNLNTTAYLGVWYEQARSKVFIWDYNCKCTQAEYSIETESPLKLRVNNTCVKTTTNKPSTFIGHAIANTSAVNECALEVAFFANNYGPYLVLDTDYTSYTIVVSCITHTLDVSDIWILSRKRALPKPTLDALVKKITAMGFDYSDIVYTTQTGCPM
eukprot:TRINITY_DN56811_c0_g1_i1.p1 TRINITY_DN56811_c0_g1~~TRINITY_DN56811_c0_g1_i1.p1  ORF type:complete len:193 (+),score=20.97 TRINITY_DN56811_c0_g1_i1:71-580(+)